MVGRNHRHDITLAQTDPPVDPPVFLICLYPPPFIIFHTSKGLDPTRGSDK